MAITHSPFQEDLEIYPDRFGTPLDLSTFETWAWTTFGEDREEAIRVRQACTEITEAELGTPVMVNTGDALIVGFTAENIASESPLVIHPTYDGSPVQKALGATFGVELSDIIYIPYDKQRPLEVSQWPVGILNFPLPQQLGPIALKDVEFAVGDSQSMDRHFRNDGEEYVEVPFGGLDFHDPAKFIASNVYIGHQDIMWSPELAFEPDMMQVLRHIHVLSK